MKKVAALIIVAGLLLLPVKADQEEHADIIFFETPGCDFCAEVEEWLGELQAEYGDLVSIRKVDVSYKEGWDEFKSYGFEVTPAILINEEIKLEFMNITEESLREAVEKAIKGEDIPNDDLTLWVLIIGIISGTTACVLAVAAFMFAVTASSGKKFRTLLLIALSFGLGLIFVFRERSYRNVFC